MNDCAELLTNDEIIVVSGKVDIDDFNGGYRMVAEQIISLDQARARFARHLQIKLKASESHREIEQDLAAALRPYRHGNIPVLLDFQNQTASARLKLGADWQVQPCAELLVAMQGLNCVDTVQLVYG